MPVSLAATALPRVFGIGVLALAVRVAVQGMWWLTVLLFPFGVAFLFMDGSHPVDSRVQARWVLIPAPVAFLAGLAWVVVRGRRRAGGAFTLRPSTAGAFRRGSVAPSAGHAGTATARRRVFEAWSSRDRSRDRRPVMGNRDRMGRGRRASAVGLLTIALLALGLPWALAEADCPQLLSPAAGEVMDNGRSDGLDDVVWEFSWLPCDDAEAYQLMVDLRAPGILSTGYVDVETLATEYTYTRERFIGTLAGWTWRVRARVAGVWGPWSEERSFTLEPENSDPVADFGPPADCPVPLEPVAGAALDNGRADLFDEMVWSFTWTPCPGASEYWLVALREGAPVATVSKRVRATRHEDVWLSYVPEPELENWSWWVRAKVDGAWQPWSVGSQFSVEPPGSDPPRADLMTPLPWHPGPTRPLPNVGTYPQTDDPWWFYWAEVPHANGYQLVVTAPHLAEPFLDWTFDETWVATSCSWSPAAFRGSCSFYTGPGAAPLPSVGEDWSWRVRARLGAAWGPWSEGSAFAVGPAPGGAEAWIEGRLEGWSDGSARIAGFFWSDMPLVGEGAVAPDGTFRLHLPALALSEYALEVPTDDGPVRAVAVPVLMVVEEQGEASWIAVLATSFEAGLMPWTEPRDQVVGDAAVWWWFVDRPLTRTGSERNVFGEDRDELALRHGWNMVLLRVVEVGGDNTRVLLRTTVEEPPADVGWYWGRFGE